MSEFAELVYLTVAQIPKGRVASYGQIARLCGYPRHARYVGRVLKHLPENSTLPWHRVIKSSGELAFPVNSTAFVRQANRLQSEGIQFSGNKVCLKHFQWRA